MPKNEPKDERVRILHMRDAARKALEFMQGRSRKGLDEDEMLTLALTRLLEIIGEAAKNVPEEIKVSYPNIPWRVIGSTRDRLIHGYFDVDLDVVWDIVTNELPSLVKDLETIPLPETL